MKNFKLTLLLCFPLLAEAQLTIVVENYPKDTKEIYISGNFNDWSPKSRSHRMLQQKDKSYMLTLPLKPKTTISFKFTQGSWKSVEQSKEGQDAPNRIFTLEGKKDTLRLSIAKWRSESLQTQSRISTQSPQVQIIEKFDTPQLGGSRNIRVYLPKNYTSSRKRYPVLYMHDAQNIFNKTTAFTEEWEVDEVLDSLKLDLIVVGIDNSKKRMNEYMLYNNDKYGKAYGKAYLDFIVSTLKPYIDRNYRTLKRPESTGIMGASMGGLISYYAGLLYPRIFGRIGVYSPSFWVNEEVYDLTKKQSFLQGTKMHLLFGSKEPEKYMLTPCKYIYQILKDKTLDLKFDMIANGRHNETLWKREFLTSVKWLFFE